MSLDSKEMDIPGVFLNIIYRILKINRLRGGAYDQQSHYPS